MRMLTLSFPAIAVLAVAAATRLEAQSFTFTDFSSTAGLQLNGGAVQTGNDLQVTTAALSQAGTVWVLSPREVAAGFDTTFTFRIAQQTGGGADGMAFVIHNDPLGTTYLGSNGGPLAYSGATNCLAIEIDTWQNTPENDLSANEISVHTNGSGAVTFNESFSIGRLTPTINMSDGLVHTLRVLYTPGTLRIFLDNTVTPVLTIPYDIVNGGTFVTGAGGAVPGLTLIGASAWIGFTAATGGAAETHDVLSWSWSSTPLPDPCFSGTVGVATGGGAMDVLTAGASTGGILRRVDTTVGQPLRFAMAQPASNPFPARFAIYGLIGTAGAADRYMTPFGTMCVPPAPLFGVPWLFTLASSLPGFPPGALPAAFAPWSFNVHLGVPFPVTCTIQGIIEDGGAGGASTLAVTNALVLNVNAAPAPTITTVAPLSAIPGTTITVTGTGFQAAATLMVGGIPVMPLSVTSTQMTFTCPAGVPCGSTVVVVNPNASSAPATFNPQPAITNTVFPSGTAAGGATYLIIGTGFTPGLMSVTIGGNPANIVTATATVINMMTPPGTTGSATVIVTGPTGCSVMTNYTYL